MFAKWFEIAHIDAVKQQYPERKLVAALELHTYSSLNDQFMDQYAGAMQKADEAAVFYSKHALELKRLPDLSAEKVRAGFEKPGLEVFSDKQALDAWLKAQSYEDANLLLMSSGNYDGLDIAAFAAKITG